MFPVAATFPVTSNACAGVALLMPTRPSWDATKILLPLWETVKSLVVLIPAPPESITLTSPLASLFVSVKSVPL